MKILAINSLGGGLQYHVVVSEKETEFRAAYGRNSTERAIWEFEWNNKHGFSNDNCTIPKSSVEKIITQ